MALSHTSIKLRPVEAADIDTLVAVARKAYLDHYPYLWKDGGQWYVNKVYTPERLSAECQDPSSAYFFVEKEGTPLGFLKLRFDVPMRLGGSGIPSGYGEGCTQACEKALYLDRVYLQSALAGQGVGQWLIDFVVETARQRGDTTVWLMAMSSSQAACRFYEKNGFTACGTWRLTFEQLWPQHADMTIYARHIGEEPKPNPSSGVQTETPSV